MALNDGYRYHEVLTARGLQDGETLLMYLVRRYPHSSLNEWQARLDGAQVTLDGRTVSGREQVQPGQALVWTRPPWSEPDVPTDIRLLYEDNALLAVVKPGGLPTLPGGGYLHHTLLHLVRQTYPEASPLHRLGRGTSGLVLFARTHQAASGLSRSWRDHEVQKTYLALATGTASQSSYDIRTPIGPVEHPRLGRVFAASAAGKASHSVATVLEQRHDTVLFSVDIHTGRPHQIRIHLAAIGHPLAGDPLYGPGGLPLSDQPGLPGDTGYLLHAARLVFTHPESGERLDLQADPPEGLQLVGDTSGVPGAGYS